MKILNLSFRWKFLVCFWAIATLSLLYFYISAQMTISEYTTAVNKLMPVCLKAEGELVSYNGKVSKVLCNNYFNRFDNDLPTDERNTKLTENPVIALWKIGYLRAESDYLKEQPIHPDKFLFLIFLFFVGLIPFLWHGLLNRIADLSNAIRGNRKD